MTKSLIFAEFVGSRVRTAQIAAHMDSEKFCFPLARFPDKRAQSSSAQQQQYAFPTEASGGGQKNSVCTHFLPGFEPSSGAMKDFKFLCGWKLIYTKSLVSPQHARPSLADNEEGRTVAISLVFSQASTSHHVVTHGRESPKLSTWRLSPSRPWRHVLRRKICNSQAWIWCLFYRLATPSQTGNLYLRYSLFRENRIVALKILHADSTKTRNRPNEADILWSIAEGNRDHPGREHIVKIFDSFVHSGPNGEHACIVFEALGQSVLDFQRNNRGGRLPLEMVRPIGTTTFASS